MCSKSLCILSAISCWACLMVFVLLCFAHMLCKTFVRFFRSLTQETSTTKYSVKGECICQLFSSGYSTVSLIISCGFYTVSFDPQPIKNIKNEKNRILKPSEGTTNYLTVVLCKNKK